MTSLKTPEVTNGIKHYLEIKACVINSLNNSDRRDIITNKLIDEYPKPLLSKRKLETIRTPVDIIMCLEKHDRVSVGDVSIYRDIANMLQIPNLIAMIEKHQNCISSGILREPNYWDSNRIEYPEVVEKNIQNCNENDPSTIKDKIHEIVALEIGQNWRDLARNLSIREGELDILNHNYPTDLQTKVYKILDIFQSKEPQHWKRKLALALNKSRRVDLQEKVLKIISQ